MEGFWVLPALIALGVAMWVACWLAEGKDRPSRPWRHTGR